MTERDAQLAQLVLGVAQLAKREPRFKRIVEVSPTCDLGLNKSRSNFEQLARSVVFQQLGGKAAQAIWQRVRNCVEGSFNPQNLMCVNDEKLRTAGISHNKLLCLRELASAGLDGRINFRSLGTKSDEDVIAELTKLRGIGLWTAQMFLMFQLGRLDVWPAGDFGVRNGFHLIYGMNALPTEKELSAQRYRFEPWCSIAAWYCWRRVDMVI